MCGFRIPALDPGLTGQIHQVGYMSGNCGSGLGTGREYKIIHYCKLFRLCRSAIRQPERGIKTSKILFGLPLSLIFGSFGRLTNSPSPKTLVWTSAAGRIDICREGSDLNHFSKAAFSPRSVQIDLTGQSFLLWVIWIVLSLERLAKASSSICLGRETLTPGTRVLSITIKLRTETRLNK